MKLYGKNRNSGLTRVLFWTIVFSISCISFGSSVQAGPLNRPEPDPPRIDLGKPKPGAVLRVSARSASPDQEWTYHKTSDNLHPDGNEQQMLWLINRARSNPSQEGAWLADTGNASVENAINFWGVDLGILQDEFDSYAASPPAAFDVRLYTAAKAHSEDLIARNAQDHNGQIAHVDDAGFSYTSVRGIVFSYMESVIYGHAAFNIDWGSDGGDGSGMQPDRGHRKAIMALDGEYTNAGLAVVAESDPDTEVGPLVTTGNFCYADTRSTDHFNRFLVGTVWQDANGNDQYDPGEGMAGITVAPDHGAYYAVTANSGGFALPILDAGSYQVSFSGTGISPAQTRAAVVGSQSVLLDLLYTPGAAEPQAITGNASDLSGVSANLNGTVYTNGQATDYYFQYGTTTAYGTDTTTVSTATDASVTTPLTGLAENTTYHFRLVAENSEGTSFGADQTFTTSTSAPSQDEDDNSSDTPAAPDSSGGGGCFISVVLE